jgi:hypothetical protein
LAYSFRGFGACILGSIVSAPVCGETEHQGGRAQGTNIAHLSVRKQRERQSKEPGIILSSKAHAR